MTKWICEDCGYEHEGKEAPDECPVCGALKEAFEPDSRMLLNEQCLGGQGVPISAYGTFST